MRKSITGTDGTPTGELDNFRDALRPLRRFYGGTPAKDFGPLALRAVREEMIKSGRLARPTINARIGRLRRIFRWAASMELIPGTVVPALETVAPLRRGRCNARESPGVKMAPATDPPRTCDRGARALRPRRRSSLLGRSSGGSADLRREESAAGEADRHGSRMNIAARTQGILFENLAAGDRLLAKAANTLAVRAPTARCST